MQHRVAEQQAAPEREQSVAERAGHDAAAPAGVLFQLQRELGNRQVRRLLAGTPALQAKLLVGLPGDRFECEADRVAQAIDRPATRPAGDTTAGPVIRRSATGGGGGPAGDGVARAIGQARGGGRPLPAGVRGRMERAMGADFGGIRLHTGSRADQLNQELGARAFTVGRDIFIRRSDADLGSQGGRRLLAHELTHVVQQGGHGDGRAVQRDVIQREITDEAQAVLDQANQNQPNFTFLTTTEEGAPTTDIIDILRHSQTIKAADVRAVMNLPAGAPAALESYVQAWLLRRFVLECALILPKMRDAAPEAKRKVVAEKLAEIQEIKTSLIGAGYAQAQMTPEFKSTFTHWFHETKIGIVPLDFDAHGVQHVPAADPRAVEVCATFVPGGQANWLGWAHSFIIYTDVSGKMTYISAHDDGNGWLKAEYGIWWPGKFPDRNLTRVPVTNGHAASAAFPKMIEAVDELNNSKLKYKMTEQNCNSATNYILKAGGLHAAAPSTMTSTFGWSKKLEKKIKKSVPALATLPGLPATPTTSASMAAPPTTTASGGPTGTTTKWARTAPKLTTKATSKAQVTTKRTKPSPRPARQPSPTVSPRGSAELEGPGLARTPTSSWRACGCRRSCSIQARSSRSCGSPTTVAMPGSTSTAGAKAA